MGLDEDAMPTSLPPTECAALLERLTNAGKAFAAVYPGEPADRHPVHTVYGGAHLFRRDTARRLGEAALAMIREYAPDPQSFARAVGLRGFDGEAGAAAAAGAGWLADEVYRRVTKKLATEPVEDFRIDFEDGYGVREDAEEDACAEAAAVEVAAGMAAGTLPPFIGIRIKNFGRETAARGVRTLDLFLTTLAERTAGRLPANFVVMLPKVVATEQVAALVDLFEMFEREAKGGSGGRFPRGSLKMEFMVETTQSVIDSTGRCPLAEFVRAARGRCVAAALGVYDYTASVGITASQQRIDHGACDFARHVMQVALGGLGLRLSDGATNIMPVPPHAPAPSVAGRPGAVAGSSESGLPAQQRAENAAAVHGAWRLNFRHVRRSLEHGWYQGWDLNPGQLPVRYAAVYSYFLESLPDATRRLRNFVEKAARATLVHAAQGAGDGGGGGAGGGGGGGIFDDAATAQGLLTYFIQGLRRRAISEQDLAATGLTAEEVLGRSFVQIVESRAHRR
jgi:citrate lyase beta subunit